MVRSAKSRAQRARLVRAWQTNGGSQAAFARRHGVHPRTFWGWCQTAPAGRRRPAPAPRFLPVEIVRATRPVEPASRGGRSSLPTGLEILLVSGERVRVAPETAPAWVAAIVAALRPAC
jgi:transposase-like protein